MLMSVLSRELAFVSVPELCGARVLITGLTSKLGFDLARSFADHGARLILQSPEDSPEMTELAAVLAENAAEIRLFSDAFGSDDAAVRLVQTAAQDCGGLDAVIHLVSVSEADVARLDTPEDVEDLVSEVLRLPLLLTEVAANRMRLVWSEGSILTVVRVADATGGRGQMFSDVLRARLADMIRGQAEQWAEHGIRINAVGPPSSVAAMAGAAPASEADLAAIAITLASDKVRSVTGHVLDAEGASRRAC